MMHHALGGWLQIFPPIEDKANYCQSYCILIFADYILPDGSSGLVSQTEGTHQAV